MTSRRQSVDGDPWITQPPPLVSVLPVPRILAGGVCLLWPLPRILGTMFATRVLPPVNVEAPAPGRRSRGKPPREPDLLPFGVPYEGDWRSLFMGYMRNVLAILTSQEREWNEHTALLKVAQGARDRGLTVEMPAPPPNNMLHALRDVVPSLSGGVRAWLVENRWHRWRPFPWARMLIDLHGRRHTLPLTGQMIGEWITGHAIARGLVSEYETGYQVWFVQAELVLRDADIGKLANEASKAQGRLTRGRFSDDRTCDRSMVGQARNRVNARRISFGYPDPNRRG